MTHTKPSLLSRLATYLRDSKEEARKVTWPTRTETIRYSTLVIVICLIIAVAFAGLDALFALGLDRLLNIAI